MMNDPSEYLRHVLTEDPDEKIDQNDDVDPSERTVVESLVQTLDRTEKVWVESEVNLWGKKASAEGEAIPPQDVVRELSHPLQPDIDLLLGSRVEGRRRPPLVGVEAKYFGSYKGIRGHELLPKRVDPNGNSMGGFYSGLGQALSLASMGLDRVFVWHVFEINDDIYGSTTEHGNQSEDHRDILQCYTDQVKDVLDAYDLPIGYFAHGMSVEHGNRFIPLCAPRRAPRLSPDEDSTLRGLLERSMFETDASEQRGVKSVPERPLSELDGSGSKVTVEAEVADILYVKKDVPEMPDIKGVLHDPSTRTRVPFVVDPGVSHPYFAEGSIFRFENAVDHYYGREDEVQLRVTSKTTIE